VSETFSFPIRTLVTVIQINEQQESCQISPLPSTSRRRLIYGLPAYLGLSQTLVIFVIIIKDRRFFTMHYLFSFLILYSLVSLRICLLQLFAAFALQAGVAVATSFNDTTPTVKLDSATFVGFTNGSVSRFLGIPFAQPP